jgi:hydroxyacylglutathione hydrolase
MNLEDHVGDIIRKARQMTNMSAAGAAKAAGLTEAELSAVEESGAVTKPINFATLGANIGVSGSRLEKISKGWKPVETDLSLWRELHRITTTKEYAVNCYLVWDEVSREAALFDAGWDGQPILQLIEENSLQLKHLFLTHSHEDHMAGMAAVREKFPNVRLHTNTKTAPPQHRIRANDCIQLGSLRITNRETPGHDEDGVTYLIGNWPEDAPHVAIVGDAIFAGSIGRGNQSWDLAKQKVRENIFSLPPDTLICPGHGPLTTMAQEKENNPFF